MSAGLRVHDVVRAFDGVRAVDGASLDVEPGSITGLIGPNGAGKSTMLKAVYGLVTRRAGTIRFADEDVTGLRADRLTRRGLNFVPQTENVFPTLTLAENVHVSALVLPRGERRAAVERVRRLFPILVERSRQRAGTLSGGQRKLVALARSLVAQPRLLLLDEPMAGVSPNLRVELLQHILALRERDGITLLIVEHDLDFVMRASDRVIVMNDGRVIAHGSPDEVRADERVVDAYLGARHEVA